MNDYSTCTVGIDLGDRSSVACIYTPGVVVGWFEFPMTPEGVREAFEGKRFAKVAMEAGAQSGWVTRALRQLGYEPIVANPRKLKAISANERKSDRNDALLLAKLATADATLLHPVHHRSEAREVAMSVMHARDALVRERARLISKIRSMCKGVGARLKSGGADAFVHREMDVPVALQAATGGIFAVIRALNEQITGYDKQFEPMIETSFPEARRVRQVRGVGPVTALAFVLALEDPSRFRDGRTAAAFLGLVPRRDQSGAIDKQLGISKTGNDFVRRLLVQCAHYILGPLGHDCDLRRWGLGLMERGGKSSKKRAIVATARKLAVLLFRLWKRDEEWKPLYNNETPPATETSAANADRPKPTVQADCASAVDDTGDRERRRIDCSASDGSDPSMHRAPSGPPKSADRSMGQGTAASVSKQRKPEPKATRKSETAQPPSTPTSRRPSASTGPRNAGSGHAREAAGRAKPAPEREGGKYESSA